MPNVEAWLTQRLRYPQCSVSCLTLNTNICTLSGSKIHPKNTISREEYCKYCQKKWVDARVFTTSVSFNVKMANIHYEVKIGDT